MSTSRESKRPRVKPSMQDTVIQRIGRELDERVKGARQGANNRKVVRAILAMINVIKLILMSMGKYNDTACSDATKDTATIAP